MPTTRTSRTRTRASSPLPSLSPEPTDEQDQDRMSEDEAADEGNVQGAVVRDEFNRKVYEMVRRIPEGKVCAYGQIAKLIHQPRHSRLVGAALKNLPRALSSPYLPQAAPPPRADRGNSPTDDADIDAEQEEEEDAPLPPPLPNPDVVPWWRVVSASGVISPRGSTHALERQADFLRAEGVEVKDGLRNGAAPAARDGEEGVDVFGLGGAVAGGRVSMAKFGWKG